MRRNFFHFAQANLFSLLMLGKFAALILWDMVSGQENFGAYALVAGLVGGIAALASLRARMLVLCKISTFPDFQLFRILLLLAGVLALVTSLWLYQDTAWTGLVLLILLQKLAENFLLAGASFEQVQQGRERAFTRINLTALFVLAAFSAGLLWSLQTALILELAVVFVAIVLQSRAQTTTAEIGGLGLGGLATHAASYSLAAGLNAGLISLFLALGLGAGDEAALLFYAKLLALQAIVARLAIGNVLYFTQDLTALIKQHRVAIAVLAILLSLAGVFSPNPWLLAAAFTALNLINMVLRQQVLVSQGAGHLVPLHGLEFAALGIVSLWFSPILPELFLAFVSLRALRIFALTILLTRPQKITGLA